MRRFLGLATALALVFGAGAANAALMLRITDGSTTIDIVDGGTGDTSPLEGLVGYNSSVSGNVGGFTNLSAVGISKPAEGSASSPELSLNISGAMTSSTAGASVLVTDTDFMADLPTANLSVLGGTGGNLNARYFGDSGNDAFGMDTDIGSFLNLSGNFDETKQESISDEFGSLTIQWDIGISVGESAGGTASLALVPEPTTALLLAFGLTGLAVRGRRPR